MGWKSPRYLCVKLSQRPLERCISTCETNSWSSNIDSATPAKIEAFSGRSRGARLEGFFSHLRFQPGQ